MSDLTKNRPETAEPLYAGDYRSGEDRSEPLLRAGNTNCGGCGMSVALNMLSLAAAEHRVQMVIPACCGIVTPGRFPNSAYGAPVVASTFASAAAVATGLAHVATMNDEDTRVVCFAGDGGTYDIGMATLSAAAERDEDVLYVCYDNEIYGNTGGQRSSSTPIGAATTTTPGGKDIAKKDIVAVMAAHRIPYVASVSMAHPEDARRKMEKALALKGFRFLHVFSPCPTGWKSEPGVGIELVRQAVRAGLFPVVEVEHGRHWTIDVEPTFDMDDLAAYFEAQGRFKKGVDLSAVRTAIDETWKDLRSRVQEDTP